MADISKIKPNGTTYNLKDSYARNMESLDSTERVVGVGRDGTSTLYKKTVKYTKPANSDTQINIPPSDLGMTTLSKVEKAECWMDEYYNNSNTPTGSMPTPIDFKNSTAEPWIAWYISRSYDMLQFRMGTQYQTSKLVLNFTFWYTK